MSNTHISLLGNVKILSKHLSTQVSFKITIRKRNGFIDIG